MPNTGFIDLFDPTGLEFTNPGAVVPPPDIFPSTALSPEGFPLPGIDALSRPNVDVGAFGPASSPTIETFFGPGAGGPAPGLFPPSGSSMSGLVGTMDPGMPFVTDTHGSDDPSQWEVISLAEAQQRDPQGIIELAQTSPEIAGQVQQAQQTPTMAGQQTSQVSPTDEQLRQMAMSVEGLIPAEPPRGAAPATLFGIPIKNIELGLGLGAAGVGLVGLIQKMVAGDANARSRVQETFKQGTPQQQQAIQQITEALQGIQAQQSPLQQQAFRQALTGQQGLTRDVLPQLGLGGLLQQQREMVGPLGPIAQGLAQGRLPMSPELERTVEEAFTPQLAELSRRVIEQARKQGFAGGAELLTQTPAAALAGPALAQMQGQQAAAKLALAQSLPALASQLAGSLTSPIATRGVLGQGLIGTLGGFGQQAFQNPLAFLGAQQAGLGGQTAAEKITRGPAPTLLDLFDPLQRILGGLGGTISQFGNLSGVPPTQSPQTTLAALQSG